MLNKLKSTFQLVLFSMIVLGLCTTVNAQSLEEIMKARGLTQQDMLAAAKTYTPTGKMDEYYCFSSGGQSGHVIAYGVPSMKLLKYIAVFSPEPWQGYGYGDVESEELLNQGRMRGRKITWGDTHHPALSETAGEYDGKYLFINDKANPRVAVIDLKTFSTIQIVPNPIMKSEHGSTFVTPNTEYILEATQYPAPFSNKYVSLDEFNEKYRGAMSFWKFDMKKGKIIVKDSFSVELPPYCQDLSDSGKKVSEGWVFTNSFNSERYVGGFGKGNTKWQDRLPFEAGASSKDTDYLHMINLKTAEKLFKDGKTTEINGHAVITMKTMVENNALFLIPEPKSPHGVMIDPSGQYITVSGKLDTHVSVYDFKKMMKLVESKKYEGKDPYNIPILSMKESLHGQVELGLGPLHTQYDKEKGIAYTSLFVDSAIAKWDYLNLKLLEKISIHYNVGHLVTAEGDTVSPDGKYMISLNKLSIDRFLPVGPLHPQNHQLIDISPGKPMQMLYDMPFPLGEPHYALLIKADKLKPIKRYKKKWFKNRVKPGREKVVKEGNQVTIHSSLIRSHYSPEIIEVNVGDEITWHITNLERAQDETHGFSVDLYNIHGSLEPGETCTFKFTADMEGVFPFYCTEFCSALHLEMMGYLLVKP
ncbi:Sec-dependent nitrous-oxide reductase [Desulfococcaceae bacterium HSG7]|nr:Sec-dependent nitrous-oxide reductase [Desulfococcaceae bacterium HSG9]MDM8554402.1 Sec-dependent nitrous-oxide reductase [Desulfococcaceae bacterium HSG7]